MNTCKHVEKWLRDHPQESLPKWIQNHIQGCSSCKQIVESSSLLHTFTPVSPSSAQYSFSPELDWKIRNCIYTTSETLKNSQRIAKKTVFYLHRGFVATLSAICLIVAVFFMVPVANQNTTYSLLLNEKFKEMMQTPSSVFMMEVDTMETMDDHLQFARYYCETKEEREFLYSNNEDSRNKLLFVKFLGMQSDVSYLQIYQYARNDLYFQAIRKAKLPLWKTWREFSSYIEQYTLLPGQPFESFDATVLSVDYATGAIKTDVFTDPLFADFIIMQQVTPFRTYHFTVKTISSQNNIVAIDLPRENDTSLQGKLLSVTKNTIRLEGFPEDLFVSEKVLHDETANSYLENGEYVFVRIAQTNQNQWVVTSLSVLQEPSPRTLTGKIVEVYRNGFVLENLGMSFFFSSPTTPTISQYDIITVQGLDYGSFFVVEKVLSIAPFIEEKEDYYLASHKEEKTIAREPVFTPPNRSISSPSPVNPPDQMPLESDIVVGIDKDQYYFLSGKTVPKDQLSQSLSAGESIRYQREQNNITIQRHFMNQTQVVQFTVEFLERLPNGIEIYHAPQDGSRIYVFRSSMADKGNVSVFQGNVVSYGTIHIALEWRMFSLSTLVNIQAVVTKEIERNSLYQLDNGCVLKIDDFTEIQGHVQVGKTVKISGQYDQNVLRGYIVRVEKEIFMMQGEIVDWNKEQKWFLLDSGVVIQIHEATIFHGQGVLGEGIFVYCKVYLKEGQYVASDIAWEENSIPGTGDRI
ncbi:MAG: hypothetical protein PHI40_00360 [Caldisericia bacterium]|nr:hypothetical protein [Caldisericia bacterium]MDD4613852.1 hypothetical protein [Caldisericia bacterium]